MRRPTSARTATLRADAVTVSPFLGYGSLRPALDLAEETGRGVFVLALTSNPEGFEVQHAVRDERSVAASVVAGAAADNAGAAARGELGSVGLVIGATVGDAVHDLGIDLVAAEHADPGAGVRRAGRDGRGAPADLRAARCRRCWPAPAARCWAPARTWPPSEPPPRERRPASRTLCVPDRTQMFAGFSVPMSELSANI